MTGSRTLLAEYPIVLRLLLVAALAALVVGLQATLPGGTSADDATLMVNSTGDDPDADPQDGDCATANDAYEVGGGVVDECTLRAAIQQANKSGAKVISFDPEVFPPGTPATIVVDPGDIGLPFGLLPQIEVEMTVDATGAGVVLDGAGELPLGLVVAYDAGKDFSLLGGGDSFAIQGFTSPYLGMTAGLLVCGGDIGVPDSPPLSLMDFGVCFDNTLDQITIEGVAISGSSYGVAVMGPNVNNLTVTNSEISTPSACNGGGGGAAGCLNPGIAGVGVSVFSDDVELGPLDDVLSALSNGNLWPAVKELPLVADEIDGDLTDTSINISGPDGTDYGNNISGGVSAVMVGVAGNLLSGSVAVSVSNNDALAGGIGPGVGLTFCGDAVDSEIDFAVDDNTSITSDAVPNGEWPAVYANINDLKGCSEATNVAASVSVSGNGAIISGDGDGVEIDARVWDGNGGASKNTATVEVNDNGEITGVQSGAHVYTRVGGIDGSNNAATVEVNGNGEITGEAGDGVYVDADAGEADYNSISVQVMDNDTIAGEGGDGVQVQTEAGDDSIFNSSTVAVSGNGTVTGSQLGVEVWTFAGDDDNNTSTVHVDDNEAITGGSEAGVYIDNDACCGNGNVSTVTVNGNGEIGGGVGAAGSAPGAASIPSYALTGATIISDAGGGSSENASTVEVIGNETVTGLTYGVYVDGAAGTVMSGLFGAGSVAGNGTAIGNESTITVSENGVITGDSWDGVYARSRAGWDPCCEGPGDASLNTSTVVVGATDGLAGNGDIAGGEHGVRVMSEAGSRYGSGDDNASEVSVNENGHILGHEEDGIEIISRAGTGPGAFAGVPIIVHGDGNTSAVTVEGTGEHDITGGEGGILVVSEAGAQEYDLLLGLGEGSPAGEEGQEVSGGSDNASDVTVTGNRDIAGGESEGVGIISAAGARPELIINGGAAGGGEGDNNHATVTVTDNRDITTVGVEPFPAGGGGGPIGSAALMVMALAGGYSGDSAESSTTVTITGNDDILGGFGGWALGAGESEAAGYPDAPSGDAIYVKSTVCCDPLNANNVEISENTGDIAGDGEFGEGIDIDLCCSANTVDIMDNEGTISGEGAGISIYPQAEPFLLLGASEGIAGGPSIDPDTVTIATISGNSISNSGGPGIWLQTGAFREAAEDGARSQITENAIANNGGAGILIDWASGLLIGPDNVIEDNGSVLPDTGIHIWGDESDGNTITQNSIFDNHGLGIDLDDFGEKVDGDNQVGCIPNGAGGPPSIANAPNYSPNECLPFPEGMNFVNGKVSGSTAPPDSLVEIFIADNVPADQENHGEGKTFVGSAQANGDGLFNLDLPCGLPEGLYTATATDKAGNTSEFGPNALFPGTQVCSPTATPTITLTPTITPTPTDTPTPTETEEPVDTPTPTITPTATITPTGTLPTATSTPTASVTPTGTLPTATDTAVPPTATDTPEPTDTPVTPEPPFTPGDVNKDGVVNSVDAAIILQYTADLIPSLAHPLNADADQDGEVNAIDAALILQFEANLIDCLPPEVCGDAGAEAIVAQVREILALW